MRPKDGAPLAHFQKLQTRVPWAVLLECYQTDFANRAASASVDPQLVEARDTHTHLIRFLAGSTALTIESIPSYPWLLEQWSSSPSGRAVAALSLAHQVTSMKLPWLSPLSLLW